MKGPPPRSLHVPGRSRAEPPYSPSVRSEFPAPRAAQIGLHRHNHASVVPKAAIRAIATRGKRAPGCGCTLLLSMQTSYQTIAAPTGVEEPRSVGARDGWGRPAFALAPASACWRNEPRKCAGRFAKRLGPMLDGLLDCFVSQPVVSGGS
jgi:hypothetical protein